MRIGVQLDYGSCLTDVVSQARAFEAAGADALWAAEAYGVDAVSLLGNLAAVTNRVKLGTAIVPIFSRTPSLLAMTAVGLDELSAGRFILGLGISGPGVIEGWHGVPFDRPLARTRDVVSICHQVWRRERLNYQGESVQVPMPHPTGEAPSRGLRLLAAPGRNSIPIYLAGLGPKSVTTVAEIADGWHSVFFWPERSREVWGSALEAGTKRRDPSLPSLEIVAGGPLAIGDGATDARAEARARLALYVGAMGPRGQNAYADLVTRYGYAEAAETVTEHYNAGRLEDASAAVPSELVDGTSLIGSADRIRSRLTEYRQAGVTQLNVTPIGPHKAESVRRLRSLVDE